MKLTLPLKVALLSVAACTTMVTEAQTIQVSDEAFFDKPVLPFAAPNQPVVGNNVGPVVAAVPPQPLTSTTYSVARSDRTLREALVKWASLSGWTFEPEHWAVARDIPVAGGASVDADFKTAVRMLLRSTELTDLPVQPCFYNANHTLRVVPLADSCTRGN